MRAQITLRLALEALGRLKELAGQPGEPNTSDVVAALLMVMDEHGLADTVRDRSWRAWEERKQAAALARL